MSSPLEKYTQMNDSYCKTLTFGLGLEAGFFSEFNNMVLGILYCLQHHIQFTLHSGNANFRLEKGWKDYFEPFCEEKNNWFTDRFDHRFPSEIEPYKRKILQRIKRLYHIDYFTYDLFIQIRTSHNNITVYSIPELNINGNLQQACRTIIKMIWQFNAQTNREINKLIDSIMLPEQYIGFHIRAGDKISEHQLILPKTYIEKAMSISSIHVGFVLTDDYDVLIELQNEFPQWKFYTLCNKDEHGYYHAEFTKRTQHDIKEAHIKLFASMEILANSDFCIGTYSSNPGMYLGLRMPEGRFHGVDIPDWQIW